MRNYDFTNVYYFVLTFLEVNFARGNPLTPTNTAKKTATGHLFFLIGIGEKQQQKKIKKVVVSMAIFHLSTKPIQRSAGRSAVAAAAYRSAIKLTDETTGTTFNYEKKHNNVVKSECFLFADGQKILVDRSSLWNEAERSEKRKDARTAREIIINLPHEVDDEHRELLVNQFTEQLAKRYQVAIDWAIHRPDKGGDQRNHHAHIMMTTRTAELKNNKICLNEKSVLELSNSKLTKLNQPLTKDQITQIRSDYAALTNELFLSLGIDERVDHRSNVERGLDTLPTKKMGQEATALERKGTRTVRGDYNVSPRPSPLLDS